MQLANNQEAFLALVKAGLWEIEARLLPYGDIEFEKVYELAEEQSVVGLVAAGLEHVVDVKAPQEIVLQIAGEALLLEQQNLEMNHFVEELIQSLRKADIYTLLVKGQGIAQCYERPLWRANGDIDLYLSETNYKKAQSFLTPKAQYVDSELYGEQHIAMHIDGWIVELHGAMPTRLIKRIDKVLEKLQYKTFCWGEVRTWRNGSTMVFLPSPDNDVLFVFTHILKHFYRGGIGLRQICDWCRLMWTYRDTINHKLLESRIKEMGLMTEWKAFAALAVEHLGMPVEAMPLFNEDDNKNHNLHRKAELILEFVLESGNFGYNRDTSYYSNRPYVIRKALSLKQHTIDGIHHFRVFPLDSIRIWCRILKGGLKAVVQRR